MRRRALVVALLPAACADRPDNSPAPVPDTEAAQVVQAEINALRARNGLAPVLLHPLVTQAAATHAREMLDLGAMTHRGRDGSDAGIRLRRAGYAFIDARENLAAGITDPRRVVAVWMRSGAHRETLLGANAVDMGVAQAHAPGSMMGGVPRIFWALVLATPR